MNGVDMQGLLKILFMFTWIFICGSSGAVEPPAQCKPLPITLDVLIDWTNNMKSGPFHKDAFEQILLMIVPNLPDHSRVYINAIGENFLSEIVSFDTPYNYTDLLDSLQNYSVTRSGNSVNLRLVDEELGTHFTVNEYRKMAEIVLLLVNSKTETMGETLWLYKKKATMGVSGDHIPASYRAMASDDNHVHLINEDGVHLKNVTDGILNQIFCDSEFLCDRDQYRTKRGIRCMNCTNVCGDGNSETLTCTTRCPFLYRPSPKEEKLSGEISLVDIIATVVVVSLVTLFLLVACILWRHRQQKRKNAGTLAEKYRKDTFPVMEQGELGGNDRQSGTHNPNQDREQPEENLPENSDTSSDEEDDTGSNAGADNADHPSSDTDHLSSDAEDPSLDERMPLFGSQTDLPQPNTCTTEIVSVEERRRTAKKEQFLITFRELQANSLTA